MSANRRRLGHITKQGSSILRFLLVEAAQVTVRSLPEWRSKSHCFFPADDFPFVCCWPLGCWFSISTLPLLSTTLGLWSPDD
jgi:hypothetical protein